MAYPKRDRKRVTAWIDIDRWHGWGKFENTQQAGVETNFGTTHDCAFWAGLSATVSGSGR